jgi:hypothetical protein
MALIPSYYEGLLSEDDMSSLRNQSIASGLLNAGAAFSRAGAPSLMPQGSGFSEALQGFNQGYQGQLDSALQNMLKATQVQELVRKQKQAQQLQTLLASAYTPGKQTAIPSEIGPAVVEAPGTFDVEKIAPQLAISGNAGMIESLRNAMTGPSAKLSDQQQQYAQTTYGTTNFARLPKEAQLDVLGFGQIGKPGDALKNLVDASKLVYETGTGGEVLAEARKQYALATGKMPPTSQQIRSLGAAAESINTQVTSKTPTPDTQGFSVEDIPRTERKGVPQIASPSLPLKNRQELMIVQPQEQAATTSIAISMRDINDTVDRLLQNQSGIKSATGFGGELQSRIGGTTAANAKADLDRVKSAISLSAIAKMRAESKTGGAVGNMTEKEWPRFESIYGSLEQAQTSDQVIKNLRELKGLTTETQESIIKKYDSIYGGGQDIRKTISTPRTIDITGIPSGAIQKLQSNPTPDMIRFFDQKFGKGAAASALRGQ